MLQLVTEQNRGKQNLLLLPFIDTQCLGEKTKTIPTSKRRINLHSKALILELMTSNIDSPCKWNIYGGVCCSDTYQPFFLY